jgi:parvulin-like peptidyl-prolyl isomerase
VQQFIRLEIDERITAESIPAADVEAYFTAHPDEFHREEMVRASHVLVKERTQAVGLLKQLRAGDTREFRQIARRDSVDTETKLRGGDLRYFTREGRPPGSQDAPVHAALVAAAFGLREVGDLVREPVGVDGQWSIVRLTGRRPEERRTLAEAERGIRLQLWRERKKQAVDDRVDAARTRLAPEIHPELTDLIHIEAAAPPPGPGKAQKLPMDPGFPAHKMPMPGLPPGAGLPPPGAEPDEPAE